MNSLNGSLFYLFFLCILFYFLSSILQVYILYCSLLALIGLYFLLVSPSRSMSSAVIQSGPGAEFLLEIFITYLISSSVKYVTWACLGVF